MEQIFDQPSSWLEFDFPGSAMFFGTRFLQADFWRARFRGIAFFNDAEFGQECNFNWARFDSGANIQNATFASITSFRNSQFHGHTDFVDTKFAVYVDLSGTTFTLSVDFGRCAFSGPVEFANANLPQGAIFEAVQSDSSFSLAHSSFAGVPNFTPAVFREAPGLDNIIIARPIQRGGNRDEAVYYRKLRGMAISSHDYDREREFFANELRARRESLIDDGLHGTSWG